MTKPRLRKTLLAAAALVVLGAGTAAAFIARGSRQVTTTSAEARRLYRQGLENERRLYHKDALAAYAKALELDPHFTMATLRLAGILSGRDRERAKSLVRFAARNHGALNERETRALAIYEADILEANHDKAGTLIRDYVRRFPDDPEGYYRLADVLMREGNGDETLATYERLLSLDPNQAVAYNYLGYHFIGRRDFVKAEDYLKRYRFLAPDQANPYDSLGELYANTGRYDEAEENLKRALEIKPDFFPAVGHLGTVEVGRGNPAAAASDFRRAADLAESWKDRQGFTFSAALSLLAAGRPTEAIEEVDRLAPSATPSPPSEEFARRFQTGRARAAVLALSGRADEAEAELTRLPAFPSDVSPKDREYMEKSLRGPRAAVAWARGDLEGGGKLLREILADEEKSGAEGFGYFPGLFDLRVRLADALVGLGRPEEAREALRPVLAVNPRFAPALAVIARIEGRSPSAAAGR